MSPVIDHDRTVHGTIGRGEDRTEIVRYDRAGKWYIEKKGTKRKQVSVTQAAQLLVSMNGHWYPNRPGSGRFDTIVRDAREEARIVNNM
jgi:hypothetical protein